MLVGAMGTSHGIPYLANPSATKAYISALGEALHDELEKHGVTVTVLTPGLTDTAAIPEIMIDPGAIPMKPNAFRAAIAEGRIPLGHLIWEFGTRGIARIVESAGVDFVLHENRDPE